MCRVARDARLRRRARRRARHRAAVRGHAAGAYLRVSAARKDLSLPPPGPTLLDALQAAGVRTVCVGKVAALFAGQGVDEEIKTAGNADGVEKTLQAIADAAPRTGPTFVWTNLVDFDELFGHRGDAAGFARALEAFDAALPRLEAALPPGDVLIVTADHGNDPTTPGSDHTRERVPAPDAGRGRGGRPRPGHGRDLRRPRRDRRRALFGVAWDGPGTPR